MTRTKALVAAIVALVLGNVLNTVLSVRAADHADHLATTIQQQRASITLANCNDQNTRETNAIAALNHLVTVAEGHATPAARARAIASEAPIVLLINAIVPHRDCAAVVKKTTGVAPSGTKT